MNHDELPACYYRISVKALVFDDTRTKFLLTKDEDGYWDLPGGGLDWGENPEEALRREIAEEMGIKIIEMAKKPDYFFPIVNPKVTMANVVYETVLENLDFKPSDECVEIRFIEPNELENMQIKPNVVEFAKLFSK